VPGCCDEGVPLTSPNLQSIIEQQAELNSLATRVAYVHDWAVHGTDDFTPVVITDDDPQVFSLTAPTGTGTITGTVAGNGNHRVAYVHSCPAVADGEMTSLILGPTAFATTNAQQGHIHRVREISPGVWEGIAVWTAVVGGGYELINTRGVRWDGVTLQQSNGDIATSADTPFLDRSMRVYARERFQFGAWFNRYHVLPRNSWGQAGQWGLQNGDLVTITAVSGTGFNETNVAVQEINASTGYLQVQDPADTGAVAYAVSPDGLIIPSSTSSQKRWTPYYLATRVVDGSASAATVEWKRWRYEEGPDGPDWSDARVQRRAITPSAGVPELATEPGQFALWAAHFHTGSAGSWGSVRFRQVTA
jgi:hypothetical protein